MKIYTIEYDYMREDGSEGSFAYHYRSLSKAIDKIAMTFKVSADERKKIEKDMAEHHIAFLNYAEYKIEAKANGRKAYPTHIHLDFLHG